MSLFTFKDITLIGFCQFVSDNERIFIYSVMENSEVVSRTTLTLVNRASLSLSGVRRVKSSEPACVVAILDNCTVVISGSNLTVQNVSISSGTMELTGVVSQIKYANSASRKFSFRNIFK